MSDAGAARDAGASHPSSRQTGDIGERLARVHLESRGYRVVEANYRSRWGEIDLIARRGPVWVFVEVRTRRSNAYGSPEESLTEAKAQRLTHTAEHYLESKALDSAETEWRIDLIAINLGAGSRVLNIHHLENVVEA